MIAELEARPDIKLTEAKLADPATDADIAKASAKAPYDLPEPLLAFFREMNGAEIKWQHRDSKWTNFGAYGSINLLSLESIFTTKWNDEKYGGKPFLPFDWCQDEFYGGFDPKSSGLFWVHDTANSGQTMDASFEGYLEALLETRGYGYWQDMFIYDDKVASARGATVEQSQGRMQAIVPHLFGDFHIDKVGNASARPPADISVLTMPTTIIGFRLSDLPAEMSQSIPENARIRECLFWVADSERPPRQIFKEIAEPDIEYISQGVELLNKVIDYVDKSFDITDIVRPDLVPVGGRRGLGRVNFGFHTAGAEKTEKWLRDNGFRVVLISEVTDLAKSLKILPS